MKSIRTRGGAVLAAVATTAALAVPLLLGAQAASAATTDPTALSVDHATQYAALGGSAVYTVTASGFTGTPTHGVYVAVSSGTDSTGLVGIPCTPAAPAAGPFTCTVMNTHGATIDTLNFFYDLAGTHTYQNGDPTVAGSLIVGGAVNAVAITPTTDRTAQGVYRGFTVSATDSAGRPITGASLTVTATEVNATNGDVHSVVGATAPAPETPNTPSSGSTGTKTRTPVTASSAGASPTATDWITSQVSGTVNILVSSGAAVSQSATLTVDPGTVNDITTVTPTSPTQTSYVNKTVSTNVTLKNAAGDPVAGVTPLAAVTGHNAGAGTTVVPAVGAAAGPGVYTVTYHAGATAGQDTLTVWVNKTMPPGHTAGLDPDEAFGTVTVTVQAENIGAITSDGPVKIPAGTMSASTVFTVKTADATPVAAPGIGLTFAVSDPANYTVTPSGTTDASGQATATVTANDAAHATAGNSVVVTATVTQDNLKTGTSTIQWIARSSQTNVTITPDLRTSADGATVSFTASATDAFGSPVAGLTYKWSVTGRNNPGNNPGATGTGTTFSYTDLGQATTGGLDFVTVTATSATDPAVSGSQTSFQVWVVGSAQPDQLGISDYGHGTFTQTSPPTGPWVPTGFTNSDSTGPTPDPTASGSSPATPVTVKVIDANGNPLYGQVVSFSSTGVGGFTDSTGHPLATPTATTAEVSPSGYALVWVRSAQSGTQTITATAGSKSGTFTMTYTGQYVALTPSRVVDTRSGEGGVTTATGGTAAGATLAPNTLYSFAYGNANMPAGATAYAFNIAAITPNTVGNLRVAPGCPSSVPDTALITYQPGKTSANFVIVPNPAGCNKLTLYSDNASAAVTVDFVGYYASSAAITPITPYRVADSRDSGGAITGGTSRSFQITGTGGAGGVPAGAKAVALNITAVGPTGLGNMRVYPDGATLPNASTINYIKGVDHSTFAVVHLPANGKIDVYSDGGSANVVIDAFAYYPATSNLVTAAPVRVLDTRQSSALASGETRSFQVTGLAGVPADAQAVLVNVTAVHAAGSTGVGNLRVFPAGAALPTVSTVNYVSKTSDVGNFAIVKLGPGGMLSLYSDGSPINATVDVVGYVPAGS